MTKILYPTHILAGLALAGAAAVTPLPAANGDIPIYQPTTITAPGRYVVTRDITAQGDVIVLQSGGVSLDLNGHTITSITGSGVVLDLVGAVVPIDDVANGRIVGGVTGIKGVNIPAGTTLIVDKVGITGPIDDCIDMPGPARVVVRDSVLRGCGRDGIRMTGNGNGLLECKGTHILDVNGNGIFASSTEGVIVRGSTIRGFAGTIGPIDNAGVRLVAPGKLGLSVLDSVIVEGGAQGVGVLLELAGGTGPIDLRGNTIAGNGASGIDLRQGAARITGNTIAANLGDGIRVDAAGTGPIDLKDNSILGNTLNGVDIRAGVVRLNGNTVGGNLQNGVIVAGARALVESNFLEGNGGVGLKFLNGTGHAYRGNFLRGNTGGDVQDPFSNTDAGGNIK